MTWAQKQNPVASKVGETVRYNPGVPFEAEAKGPLARQGTLLDADPPESAFSFPKFGARSSNGDAWSTRDGKHAYAEMKGGSVGDSELDEIERHIQYAAIQVRSDPITYSSTMDLFVKDASKFHATFYAPVKGSTNGRGIQEIVDDAEDITLVIRDRSGEIITQIRAR